MWDENNLSHIDNEEISVKGKQYYYDFNLLCKSNIIKRYHHYHTLEDLISQPKKITIVTSVMGLNGRFFLRFEFKFRDSKKKFTLKLMAELTKIGYIKSLYSDQMKEHDLYQTCTKP